MERKKTMSRKALRYAIEKMQPELKQQAMQKLFPGKDRERLSSMLCFKFPSRSWRRRASYLLEG